MKRTPALYWKIFISTFTLSAFTFGGGYVIVPLMQKKFVNQYGWIDETEMLDMVAIAQSAPGPIAVNASIIIGYRLGGVLLSLIHICEILLKGQFRINNEGRMIPAEGSSQSGNSGSASSAGAAVVSQAEAVLNKLSEQIKS